MKLEKLPSEILLQVLDSFNDLCQARDVLNFGQTCRRFHDISSDNRIWRALNEPIYKEIWGRNTVPPVEHHKEFYLDQLKIKQRLKTLVDSFVNGPRNRRYEIALEINRIGQLANYQLLQFYQVKGLLSRGSIHRCYYGNEFRQAIQRIEGFKALVRVASDGSNDLLTILMALQCSVNRSTGPQLKGLEEVLLELREKEQEFISALPSHELLSSLSLSSKAQSVFSGLQELPPNGRHYSIVDLKGRSYNLLFLLPFHQGHGLTNGPLTLALVYQHFASLIGLKTTIFGSDTEIIIQVSDTRGIDSIFLNIFDGEEVRYYEQHHLPLPKVKILQMLGCLVLRDVDWFEGFWEFKNSYYLMLRLAPAVMNCSDAVELRRAVRFLALGNPFDAIIYEWIGTKADQACATINGSISRSSSFSSFDYINRQLNPSAKPHTRTFDVKYRIGQVCKFKQKYDRTCSWGIIVGWNISKDPDQTNVVNYDIISEHPMRLPLCDPQETIDHIENVDFEDLSNRFLYVTAHIGKYFCDFDHVKNVFVPVLDLRLEYPEDYSESF